VAIASGDGASALLTGSGWTELPRRTPMATVNAKSKDAIEAEFDEPFDEKKAQAYRDTRSADLKPKIASFSPDHPLFQRAHRNSYFAQRQAVNERIGQAWSKRSMRLLRAVLDEFETLMLSTLEQYRADLESARCEHGKLPTELCLQCSEVGTPSAEEIRAGAWADDFVSPRRRSNS
jgi:hypothetical protein